MEPRVMNGAGKLQQVTQLLDTLEKDLERSFLTSAQRERILLELRQFGTEEKDADPIYCKRGLEILGKYAVDGETPGVCWAGLRCVANTLLNNMGLCQVWVDIGYSGKVAQKLRSDSSDDEMFAGRVLFLSTYDTTLDFDKLIKENHLADNILHQISRHAKQFPKSGRKPLSKKDELAFTETLKLSCNIAKIYPNLARSFTPSIPSLLKIVSRIDLPSKPLDGLIGYLLNCLSNFGLGDERFDNSVLFPKFNQNCNVDKLINILDQAVSSYSPQELNSKAIPLLYVLFLIHENAPDRARKYMQWLLLPEDSDRSEPIGKSDTLSSRLLALSTSPFAELKTAISDLMYSLSDKNPENFTRNIGYGLAAGLLASRGIEVPRNAKEAYATGTGSPVNPITGQRLDAEPQDTNPPMTKEDKEREAERLFVLFESASARGIVENPVRVAQQQGRLEELPDSDSDD